MLFIRQLLRYRLLLLLHLLDLALVYCKNFV